MDPYSKNFQRLICLLYALNEKGGFNRKQDVIEHIQRNHYLWIKPGDLTPYITQVEPRWHTDIAYRRKDGVQLGFLFDAERDSWGITRDGRYLLELVIKDFRSQELQIKHFYLWTPVLKKKVIPNYVPSERETKPPIEPYNRYIDL